MVKPLVAEYSTEHKNWTIKGQTFPYKEKLSEAGCWWDRKLKVWHFEGLVMPIEVLELCELSNQPEGEEVKEDHPVEGHNEDLPENAKGDKPSNVKVKKGNKGKGDQPPQNMQELAEGQGQGAGQEQGEGEQGEQGDEMTQAEQDFMEAMQELEQIAREGNPENEEDQQKFKDAMQKAAEAAQRVSDERKEQRQQQASKMATTLELMRQWIQDHSAVKRAAFEGDNEVRKKQGELSDKHDEMKQAIVEFSKLQVAVQNEKRLERAEMKQHERSEQERQRRHNARMKHRERIKNEVKAGAGFVAPSWWGTICMYLLKGMARPVVNVVGPTGNGKTRTSKEALEAIYGKGNFVVVDCTAETAVIDLLGTYELTPQGEVWRDGKVTHAFRNGLPLLINEYDALDPRVGMALQSAFQDKSDGDERYVTLPNSREEDRVYPQDECPIVLTSNTFGQGPNRQYVGRNKIDSANLNRMSFIDTRYENIGKIVQSHGYKKATGERLEKWFFAMHEKIEKESLLVVLSPRDLLRMAQAIECYGWDWETTLRQEFWSRMDSTNRELLGGPKDGAK